MRRNVGKYTADTLPLKIIACRLIDHSLVGPKKRERQLKRD